MPDEVESACIEHVGWKHKATGYGGVGKNGYAHRAVWEAERGPIPPGMVVMHVCDNPPCVNVEHLRLGTQAENVADMDAKGRRRTVSFSGEGNGMTKLSDADVHAIRARRCAGATLDALADEYGVHRSRIWQLTKRGDRA